MNSNNYNFQIRFVTSQRWRVELFLCAVEHEALCVRVQSFDISGMQSRPGPCQSAETRAQVQSGPKKEQDDPARGDTHLRDDGIDVQALLASRWHSARLVSRLRDRAAHDRHRLRHVVSRVHTANTSVLSRQRVLSASRRARPTKRQLRASFNKSVLYIRFVSCV